MAFLLKFLDTNGTYKYLLSTDSFKPRKNITVFESITDRKTRVSLDAQNKCAITLVGTALKIALWVHLVPIPLFFLLPANFCALLASLKFEFSELLSRGVSSDYRSCECISPVVLFPTKFGIFFRNLIFTPLFQLEMKFNLFLIVESASSNLKSLNMAGHCLFICPIPKLS